MVPSACYPDPANEVNRILETLADDLRREVIYYFERIHDAEAAPVRKIVSHLDAEIPGTDPERLTIRLVHTHLPKLNRRGWIDYDAQTEIVQYHGHDNAHARLSEVCAMLE